ncbi:MAG TPA: IS110 family transposase [Thiobacillus sp.]
MNAATHVISTYVGIDVSKRKLDCAILLNGKIKSKVVSNDRSGFALLDTWLKERSAFVNNTHICMEATGPYSEQVALALVDLGWIVSVVNPARIKGFAQSELARNKTDCADAALLARFCAAMNPSVWTPPSPAYRQLRAMVERLQALKDMHQQEVNRLEAHHASGETTVLPNVKSHIAWLDKQIAKLQREINDHIDGHPELKQDAELIASIPGIGETTVAKVLAYAGNVRRFTNAKALAAFIGICPRQRQSGSSVKGRTLISRTGHAELRKALYMPGLVALRHNPILQIFGARMKANGLAPKAVVGAAMRKLAHLIYGVVKSGKPFDANFAMNGVAIQDGI